MLLVAKLYSDQEEIKNTCSINRRLYYSCAHFTFPTIISHSSWYIIGAQYMLFFLKSPSFVLTTESLSVMRTNSAIMSLLVRPDSPSRNWSPIRGRTSTSVWSGWSRWVPMPWGFSEGEGGIELSGARQERGCSSFGEEGEDFSSEIRVASWLCLLPTLVSITSEGQCGVAGWSAWVQSPAMSLLPGLRQGSELFWASVFLVYKMGITTAPAS